MNLPESPLPPFKSVGYTGSATGPRLIVTGAVHGNETCGTQAIVRVMDELDTGALAIVAGSVTFVPITNALAYALKRRAGERNLNRALQPTDAPRQFEDRVANWLCPLLAAHDVLLDLHSFLSPGRPFVMVGPRDNAGLLEPFAHAAREEALARCLGEPAPPVVASIETLSLVEVVDKHHADDAFSRPWSSFDALREGDEIGRRADGEVLRAPHVGWIVFPNTRAEVRQEWYYLARASSRF